ncbi:hypothetical protein [Kitasatospora sp. NPDC088351]
MHLARLELAILLRELFTQLPGIRSTAPPRSFQLGGALSVSELPCDIA